MSAECDRCGWDLPYTDDCVVCDERGPFKAQLTEAQKKLDAVRVALAGWELNGSPRNSLWDRVDGILKGE